MLSVFCDLGKPSFLGIIRVFIRIFFVVFSLIIFVLDGEESTGCSAAYHQQGKGIFYRLCCSTSLNPLNLLLFEFRRVFLTLSFSLRLPRVEAAELVSPAGQSVPDLP